MNAKRYSRLLAGLLLLTMLLSLCPAAFAADAAETAEEAIVEEAVVEEEAVAEEAVEEETAEEAAEEEAAEEPEEEAVEEETAEEPEEEAAEEEEPEKELSRTLQLEPNTYEAGQAYYSFAADGADVYTVQLSSGFDPNRAEEIRDSVLAAGFDAFIYQPSGPIYTMSGKFDNLRDALAYGEAIHAYTDRSTAYVVNARLPQEAIQSFQDIFYSSCLVSEWDRDVETHWEIPTGAFFRADEGTVEVFTVQFSSGTSFHGSERNRDAMREQGYSAFVYKTELKYKTMAGMFYDYQSALNYCAAIRSNTDQDDAVVRTATVPAGVVKDFQKNA